MHTTRSSIDTSLVVTSKKFSDEDALKELFNDDAFQKLTPEEQWKKMSMLLGNGNQIR